MTTEIEKKCIDSWMKLAIYLSGEKLDGKIIFTLSFQDDCNFIVHPEGIDGNTLDLTLCFNIPLFTIPTIPANLQQQSQIINAKKQKYSIIIDTELYLVQQYLTFAQIKRLAMCDNQFYMVKICEPIPDKCRGKDIDENELIDLEMPDAPRVFQTQYKSKK